jgi:type I restriction enzyme R subunit
MDKRALSERDICTKFITPAIVARGWDVQVQVRENVHLTKGRVIVRGKLVTRGKAKFADYVLYYKPNVPIAVIEAKDNNHGVGDGMQQGLGYAEMLDVPFVFSSNGDGFLFHDRTGAAATVEEALALDRFPTPDELWARYRAWKAITPASEAVVTQDYYTDGSGKAPRYYQVNAINRVVEAVARGQDRVLLVMATGTGKTLTAFQIIWRLWKAGVKKRILFLADRNILVDQTKTNDFKPFGGAMTKITNRKVDKSFEIYLALYQAISGSDEESDLFRQFSPDFFDLDHRRRVPPRQRRPTTPRGASVLDYFGGGDADRTDRDAEGDDGHLDDALLRRAGLHVLAQAGDRGRLPRALQGRPHRPRQGPRRLAAPRRASVDKLGQEIEDRVYNQRDFDRTIVLEKRTELVAQKVTAVPLARPTASTRPSFFVKTSTTRSECARRS